MKKGVQGGWKHAKMTHTKTDTRERERMRDKRTLRYCFLSCASVAVFLTPRICRGGRGGRGQRDNDKSFVKHA